MLAIAYRSKFKKDLDLMMRRGKDPAKMRTLIDALANGVALDAIATLNLIGSSSIASKQTPCTWNAPAPTATFSIDASPPPSTSSPAPAPPNK